MNNERSVKIHEAFICGKKNDPDLCEDVLVVTDDFIAAIDGATSKTCPAINGAAAGYFAAHVAAEVIRGMPADISGKAAVASISQRLQQETARHVAPDVATCPGGEKPSCSLAIYSHARQEIWRVGDIGICLDGRPMMVVKEIDDIAARARAAMLACLQMEGESSADTDTDINGCDRGRAFILPLLQKQHLLANRTDAGVFGYGVINGDTVPDMFIEIIPAAGVAEIVLASDGYPVLKPTWAQSEASLQKILAEDPFLCRQYMSTKGMQKGQVSFDDRCYIRFSPRA